LHHACVEPKTITIYRKGQFTGEISHLTATPAIFRAVALAGSPLFGRETEAMYLLSMLRDVNAPRTIAIASLGFA
jgi:hypothetical protein